MPVGLSAPQKLLPIQGIKLAAGYCGIKADSNVNDLVLIEIAEQASTAAVFTTNKFCAAPVIIAKQHLLKTKAARYLLINSGNANAGTGDDGLLHALKACQSVAGQSGVQVEAVLPFSTGVIGQPLASEKIQRAIPELVEQLSEDSWLQAAQGIMTTDTLPKAVSRQININGQTVTITGMCKGSGMIKPDMATMLAYVATDATISNDELYCCLEKAVSVSFNAISVDGDTSTNDACVLVATGSSEAKVNSQHQRFMQTLQEVFKLLAQSIIRDGEGATKFVEIQVNQARTQADAKELGYTIAHSPLVKTALFASDANWGRILAAIGRAPVESLDINKIDLYLGQVCLIEKGLPCASYTEQKGQQEMSKQDISIRVEMNLGDVSSTIWTTDLSYEYIKINAEYRT